MFKLYNKLPTDKKYTYVAHFKDIDSAVKRMYRTIDTWRTNSLGISWQITDSNGNIVRDYQPK